MLWRGFAIGVIISAPMGPVGILCIQRTLEKGRTAGFFTGVGAAISDLFYCLLTGFGLSFIEEFLERNQNVIQLIGSLVLIIFGIYLFKSNPARSIKRPGELQVSKGRNVLNGFLFTVSNPLIIFLIIGLFARFNFLMPDIRFYHYIIGFICIAVGALAWWWMITFFISKVRNHFNLRSMWMVNKITGSIIMIFGVVGIITSVSAYAGAAEPTAYLNSTNGYGGNLKKGIWVADGNDTTAIASLPIEFSDGSAIEFRACNLHNQAGKKYPALMPDGSRRKCLHPAWEIRSGSRDSSMLKIRFATEDNILDPMSESHIRISATLGDSLLSETIVTDGIDTFCGWNAWRLINRQGKWSLLGGNREYRDLLEFSTPRFDPRSLSFHPLPGALLQVDWIRLDPPAEKSLVSKSAWLADPDALRSYLARSYDPIEGIYEVFDRSLDDSYALPGGNYRLAAINNGNGYDLIFLSGAIKNPGFWKPGMLKARLVKGSFNNIFTVEWMDVNGRTVPSECVAEFSTPATISLQFPQLFSSMRLRRVNR